MKILYSKKFARNYQKLPKNIKLLAEKKEKVFRHNPQSSKLKTHQLKGKLKGLSAFSINYEYRIVLCFVNKRVAWFVNVGTHDQVY